MCFVYSRPNMLNIQASKRVAHLTIAYNLCPKSMCNNRRRALSQTITLMQRFPEGKFHTRLVMNRSCGK
jgi:hypothetical protein